MPKCPICAKPCECKTEPTGVGSIAKPCPKQKGAIWVHVLDDAGNNIKDVPTLKDGRDKNPTDRTGLSTYDPLDANEYTIKLDNLPEVIANEYEPPTRIEQKVHVADGQITYVGFQLKRKARLKVLVHKQGDPDHIFGGAKVTVVEGPEKPNGDTGDNDGIHNCTPGSKRLKAEKYKLKVDLKSADAEKFQTVIDFSKELKEVDLAPGEERVIDIQVEPKNLVIPKIEMEYKVVLLERKLAHHQKKSEKTKHYADATLIAVSFTEVDASKPDQPYGGVHRFNNGGVFTCEPATNVDIFLDEKCENKLPPSGELTNGQLASDKKLKLYLKGKLAGNFTAKLQLNDPKDRFIQMGKNPAEETMGVVKIKLDVYANVIPHLATLQVDPDTEPQSDYHDNLNALKLPDQKVMRDNAKIALGRFLHVQKKGAQGVDNFGRAKLIVKIEPSQWPAGTDDHFIMINSDHNNGEVELSEDEWDGSTFALPHEVGKVSDLKPSKTFWVQGKTPSHNLRDIRLEISLNRPAGDTNMLSNTEKHNGDWARFTVVEVEKVEIIDTPASDEGPAWDQAQKRFYININQKSDPVGRQITIRAQLSKNLKDVPIRFMLVPDEGNGKKANWGIDFPSNGKNQGQGIKWKDLPSNLKHQDKKDRKDLLHYGVPTNASGYAEKVLTLSRFGGDKFHPAAYIDQDPHLAKYVRGHADLGKREPVFAAVTPIQVWRKVWYQLTLAPGMLGPPTLENFMDNQRKVFIEPELDNVILMSQNQFPNSAMRPQWQIQQKSRQEDRAKDRFILGDHNIDNAAGLFTAATKRTSPKFHVIFCFSQFDAKDIETALITVVFDNVDAKTVEMGPSPSKRKEKLAIFAPPLQGGDLIVSAEWFTNPNPNSLNLVHFGTLNPANIQVLETRTNLREVVVFPPTECHSVTCRCQASGDRITIDSNNTLSIQIQLRAADGPYAGWAVDKSVANVVAANRGMIGIQNTMSHELGHLFGKVRTKSVMGHPDHPYYYQKRGGTGDHCSFDAKWTPDTLTTLDAKKDGELDARGNGAGGYADGTCIIFGQSEDKKNRVWCEHCTLELILSDLSEFG